MKVRELIQKLLDYNLDQEVLFRIKGKDLDRKELCDNPEGVVAAVLDDSWEVDQVEVLDGDVVLVSLADADDFEDDEEEEEASADDKEDAA